jgi:hypothetical protein
MNFKLLCITLISTSVATTAYTGVVRAAGYTITDLDTLGGTS